MANNNNDVVWTPRTHIRFGSLNFVIDEEAIMIRALEAPTPSTNGLPNVARHFGDLRIDSLRKNAGHKAHHDPLILRL
jgi:hypothetical protein